MGFIGLHFVKKYMALDELRADLDNWMKYYNQERTHSEKYCFGKTPTETFMDSLPLAKRKNLDNSLKTTIDQKDVVCQMK